MKSIMSVELNSGQMVEDVRRIAAGRVPVHFYGRQEVLSLSEEIYEYLSKILKNSDYGVNDIIKPENKVYGKSPYLKMQLCTIVPLLSAPSIR